MFLIGFPLLLIPFAIYNIVAFLMPGVSWTGTVASIHMISGADWTMTAGQLLPISVRFKAKMTSREGLIMLAAAEGNDGSHYVALFLHKGLLQFQFSCGLQTMLLSEIEGPVNNGYELQIKVG